MRYSTRTVYILKLGMMIGDLGFGIQDWWGGGAGKDYKFLVHRIGGIGVRTGSLLE